MSHRARGGRLLRDCRGNLDNVKNRGRVSCKPRGLVPAPALARPAFVALTNLIPAEVGPRSPNENALLAELSPPVDIVFGEDDPYLNPAVAAHFDANIPTSNLTMLANAGHFVQVDAPGPVAQVILAAL